MQTTKLIFNNKTFVFDSELLNKFLELIPEANSGKHSNISTIGLSFDFVIMMILDVALG